MNNLNVGKKLLLAMFFVGGLLLMGTVVAAQDLYLKYNVHTQVDRANVLKGSYANYTNPGDGHLIIPAGTKINITKKPMYKRAQLGIGYLAQEPSIFHKLTVEENIMAILETLKLSKKERKQRLEEHLSELGLAKLAKQKAAAGFIGRTVSAPSLLTLVPMARFRPSPTDVL